MIKWNASGRAQSFVAPLFGKEAQRAAISNYLTGMPEPQPEPAALVAESGEAEFNAQLAELARTLGSDFERALPPNEIAALRADPIARARFSKNLATSRALARRDEARFDVAAAKAAVVDDERETSRLAALGLAVGAAERGATR